MRKLKLVHDDRGERAGGRRGEACIAAIAGKLDKWKSGKVEMLTDPTTIVSRSVVVRSSSTVEGGTNNALTAAVSSLRKLVSDTVLRSSP